MAASWASFFKYLAAIFTFCALILLFFTLLGNTYNVAFLRSLYIAQLTKNEQDFTNFGLWNACHGFNGTVTECTSPKGAFLWTQASGLDQQIINGYSKFNTMFFVNFILYWVGFALTLFAFVFSVFTHFNRVTDSIATLASGLAFLVLLACFVILAICAFQLVDIAINSVDDYSGHVGPCTWMTLGALVGLMLATIYYGLGCWLRRKKKPATTDEYYDKF